MSAIIVHLLIVAVVLVGAVSGSRREGLIASMLKFDTGIIVFKDARCHDPATELCNTTSESHRNRDWTVSAWYYDSRYRACRPTYSPNGVHDCVENQDLPKTREECENLCADACYTSNGSVGICMHEYFCKVHNEMPGSEPKPCGINSVNCCPQIPDKALTSTDLTDKNCNQFVHNVSTGNSFGTYYTYVYEGYLNINGK